MDFEEIKKIISADGGKFIIIEDGKPIMVIMPFDEYKDKLNPHFSKKAISKSNPKNPESPVRSVGEDSGSENDFTVDDLPLE